MKLLPIYPKQKRKRWLKNELAEFVKLYPTINNRKLAIRFGVTTVSIVGIANKMKVKKANGYIKTGCFQKGHKSWNTGIKGISIGGKETQFKKGHIPSNYKKVGTIILRKRPKKNNQNYYYIKAEPNKWELYHRFIWIQKYGKIPAGMILRFKDDNKENCRIENLILIDRKENLINNWNRNKASKSLRINHLRKKYGLEKIY